MVDPLHFPGRYGAVVPRRNTGSISPDCDGPGKGYPLLTILVTICTLTLVAADFHTQNYLFATVRKADKVASAKAILHQMGMTALGTAFRSLLLSIGKMIVFLS